jgi:hypothetical protein
MRNAFLNAPWVKAIVPIRPGRERDAIDWLKGVLEGDEGLDAVHEQQLRDLADKVDQWIEVAPTDQVAAVSVQYDPVTGRQIPPT